MTELTKEFLSELTRSDDIAAFLNDDCHRLTIWPEFNDHSYKIKRPIDGYVCGHNIDRERSRPDCYTSLPHTAKDVFKLLKVGDDISLEWWPDAGSPFLTENGFVANQLNLKVARTVRGKTEYLKLHLDHGIYSRTNQSIAICRGFVMKPEELV